MAATLVVLVLSILACKIQSQLVEVNTNLQYSSASIPAPPLTIQPFPPNTLPVALPSPPVSVALPPQYLPSPGPITLPAPQIALPPTVNLTPFPQPVCQPQTITLPASTPLQISPPFSVLPPFSPVLPPTINVPLVPTTQIVTPQPTPLISTTVVDNSLANKLANVLQLFLVSKTIDRNLNCNTPFLNEVAPFYDAVGSIGTLYPPFTDVITAPYFAPSIGVADIFVPNIIGVESLGADLYPFGFPDLYSYSNVGIADVLVPNPYNYPQYIDTGLDQLVYF